MIQLDHRVVVALIGELDAASAPNFGECLTKLERTGATHIELDVSELRFLDSAGMAILRQHRCAIEALGGTLVIQGDSSRALKLVGMTDMGQLLDAIGEHPSVGAVD